MRHIYRSGGGIIVLLALALLASLLPVARPARAMAIGEVEPNDSAETAQILTAIGLENPVEAAINTPGDRDWFGFTVVAGHSYVVELFEVGKSLGTAAGSVCTGSSSNMRQGIFPVVYDVPPRELKRQCDNNGGGTTQILADFTAGASGTFYVRVAAHVSTVSGSYKLRILPGYGEPDAAWDVATFEPNNSFSNAYLITPGYTNALTSVIEGHDSRYYSTYGDADWYRFNADVGRTYTVEVFDVAGSLATAAGTRCTGSNYNQRSGLALWVYNPARTNIKALCDNGAGDNIQLKYSFIAGATGDYYLRIAAHEHSVAGSYRLRVLPRYDEPGAAWEPASLEPNNTPETAYQILPGYENALSSEIAAQRSGIYAPVADIDYYRFEAVTNRSYYIEVFDVERSLATAQGARCTGSNYNQRSGLWIALHNPSSNPPFKEFDRRCDPSQGVNVHTSIFFTAGTSGTYVFGVTPHSNSVAGSYRVRVLPRHDEPGASWDAVTFEPNNPLYNAYPINVGGTQALFSEIGVQNPSYGALVDRDSYHFQAEADKVYIVEAYDVAGSLSVQEGTSCTGSNYNKRRGLWLVVSNPSMTEIARQCARNGTDRVHASIQFTAGTSGTYYVMAQPHANGLAGAYSLRVRTTDDNAELPQAPILRAISPSEGDTAQPTRVTISGVNLVQTPLPEVSLRSTSGVFALDAVSTTEQGELLATVPAQLPVGTYDLIATFASGQAAILPNAFTVLGGGPRITGVLPNAGPDDRANIILIGGLNFAGGATARLGGTALVVSRIGGTALLAVVPAGLAPGSYDLTVTNPGGAQAALADAYTVFSAVGATDLRAEGGGIWLNPAAPQAGQALQLGLFVRRQGGADALENVAVEFRRDAPNGPLLGQTGVPFLNGPAGLESTTPLNVTLPSAGSVTIYAIIDPANAVAETDEANNIVSRTITVAPAGADQTVPVVEAIEINAGATATDSTTVEVAISARDPEPAASGVTDVQIVEYVFNTGANQWVPVNSSGWLPYRETPSGYRWTLVPLPGMHYLQARARDAAGNISVGAARRLINYDPPSETVGRRETRIYRHAVAAGQRLTIDLEVLSGDADLYVWSSREDQSKLVSNLEGSAREQVITPVATEDLIYQIEVYGFTTASYRLNIAVADGPAALADTAQAGGEARRAGGITPGKPQPSAPFLPVSSLPDERQGQAPPTTQPPPSNAWIYLPLLRK